MAVTNEFDEAFQAGGGTAFHCACGRYHVSFEDEDEGEDEFAGFLAKQEKEPDKYIFHNDEGIGVLNLGSIVVYGCPCGTDVRYENWIWSMRRQLSEYLRERTKREFAEAKAMSDEMQGLPT
jgi:hypothetical protein